MSKPEDFQELDCAACRHGADLAFDFSMAFQPIVDLDRGEILAYEALVRGPGGESAGEVFRHVNDGNLYRFDQSCRVKAIELAARLNNPALLSINFMPNAVYRPELCIRTTIAAAKTFDFPVERIVFEVSEAERVRDHAHLQGIVEHYQQQGFRTAIDDFGAGYAGLNLLAEFQTDMVKLDMLQVRGIDQDSTRRIIVAGIVQVCRELGVELIAEGVETAGELGTLRDMGVRYFQGFYFARPAFEALAEVPDKLLV